MAWGNARVHGGFPLLESLLGLVRWLRWVYAVVVDVYYCALLGFGWLFILLEQLVNINKRVSILFSTENQPLDIPELSIELFLQRRQVHGLVHIKPGRNLVYLA